MLHATGVKLENGREKRRKTHEAEANLPHRKNGEATGKQQRRMEENGTFRTRGKAYHKPFLFARFVGFGFQKQICFRGADDRLADDEMRLFDSFCCGDCFFGGRRSGVNGPERVFRIPAPTWKALSRGNWLFPQLPAGLGETISLCVFPVAGCNEYADESGIVFLDCDTRRSGMG